MTEVTDRGVEELEHFPRLRSLTLCGPNFTQETLSVLATLKSLEDIELIETSISRSDATQFAREHPAIAVVWSSGVHIVVKPPKLE